MEAHRLGVKLELQLPAYTTATDHSNTRSEPHLQTIPQLAAMPILKPLSRARDQTHMLIEIASVS